MGVQQTNIFEFLYEQFKPKKIRLYQFFAGIGSQAKALKNLGVEFEDYKIASLYQCLWAFLEHYWG